MILYTRRMCAAEGYERSHELRDSQTPRQLARLAPSGPRPQIHASARGRGWCLMPILLYLVLLSTCAVHPSRLKPLPLLACCDGPSCAARGGTHWTLHRWHATRRESVAFYHNLLLQLTSCHHQVTTSDAVHPRWLSLEARPRATLTLAPSAFAGGLTASGHMAHLNNLKNEQ